MLPVLAVNSGDNAEQKTEAAAPGKSSDNAPAFLPRIPKLSGEQDSEPLCKSDDMSVTLKNGKHRIPRKQFPQGRFSQALPILRNRFDSVGRKFLYFAH